METTNFLTNQGFTLLGSVITEAASVDTYHKEASDTPTEEIALAFYRVLSQDNPDLHFTKGSNGSYFIYSNTYYANWAIQEVDDGIIITQTLC